MKAIRLQNFKGFKDSGWIELKPITLLFGYNSSGKSSILQALLLMKQSFGNPSSKVPFSFFSERGVDLGTYQDVVHNHKIGEEIPVTLSLRLDIHEVLKSGMYFDVPYQGETVKPPETPEIIFSVSVSHNQTRKTDEISRFSLCDANGKNILSMDRRRINHDIETYFASDYYPNQIDKMKIEYSNFVPLMFTPQHHPIHDILKVLLTAIIETNIHLHNIGPIRSDPKRTQLFSGENPETVGVRGEYAFQLLYLSRYGDNPGYLESRVNDWLSAYHYKFEWKILDSNLGQFILKDTRTGLEVNLKDTGFGLSQILPVVIQVYAASPGSTVLIEQPEIHLHARAQAELGDLFLKALHPEKKLIIETHSENLLLRIRRRIAENYIRKESDPSIIPDNIAIYFIENQEGESVAHRIPMNNRGEFENPPERFKKFFTDDFEEIMKINFALAQISASEA